MKKLVFEREVVKRAWPINLCEEDRRLFEHEIDRVFERTESIELERHDFFPNGYVARLNEFYPSSVSFQSPPRNLASKLKTFLKVLWMRVRSSHTVFASEKTPLVITNEFSNGYFHWIADSLPKLVGLKNRLFEFVLVLPSFMKGVEYVEATLRLWPELEYEFVERNEIKLLSTVYLVPPLAFTGNYRLKETNDLRAHVRASLNLSGANRKIYVSRRKAPARKIRNEAEVLELLSAYGFEEVVLEDLTWIEQVRLIAQARYLIGNHGAGLTNVLWMEAGTNVLEIRHENDRDNNCYFSLVSALSLRYYYCNAKPVDANESTHTADLVVDIAILKESLELFLE